MRDLDHVVVAGPVLGDALGQRQGVVATALVRGRLSRPRQARIAPLVDQILGSTSRFSLLDSFAGGPLVHELTVHFIAVGFATRGFPQKGSPRSDLEFWHDRFRFP